MAAKTNNDSNTVSAQLDPNETLRLVEPDNDGCESGTSTENKENSEDYTIVYEDYEVVGLCCQ